MQFKTIKGLVEWAFRIEAVPILKTQKYEENTPARPDMTPHDEHAMSSMVMLKINRLPYLERVALWAYYTGLPAHIIALAGAVDQRFGPKTAEDVVRKWATGDGPACREIGDRHSVSHMTAHRYQRDVMRELDRLFHLALATLEIQHRACLQHLLYAQCVKAA